jgi:hypothetical protein
LGPEEAAPAFALRRDLDEVRQVGSTALVLGDDRADLGEADIRRRPVAGVHQVDAAGVIDLGSRIERMTATLSICCAIFGISSQIVVPGRWWRSAGRPAGGPAGLHVERLELAGSAVHPQQDAVLAARGEPLRPEPATARAAPQFMTAPPAAVPNMPFSSARREKCSVDEQRGNMALS